jgi:dihydrofolate reductase
VAGAIAGNISAEATTPTGNTFAEAMRGRLMEWAFVTQFFAQMTGQEGGAEGLDNEFLIHSFEKIGATIMGRNMFGPQRGPWPNEDWKGWWGPNPPYHHPVFVLSHHEHSSFEMEGGTSFSFVNDGIESKPVSECGPRG